MRRICAAYAPNCHITPYHSISLHFIPLQKTTLSIKKNSIYKTLCTLFSLVLSFFFGKKSRVEGILYKIIHASRTTIETKAEKKQANRAKDAHGLRKGREKFHFVLLSFRTNEKKDAMMDHKPKAAGKTASDAERMAKIMTDAEPYETKQNPIRDFSEIADNVP